MKRPKLIQHREVFEFADLGDGYALALRDNSVSTRLEEYGVLLCEPTTGNDFTTRLLHYVPASELERAKALFKQELANRTSGRHPRRAPYPTVPRT